jgi:divalent metal cation (Fe/Co/Zn/Cd) transporter
MIIEAAVAITTSIMARSLVLMAFGLDSIIELASAGVLMWRLAVELKAGLAFPEAIEIRASKVASALLFALAAYVILTAGSSLWYRVGADFSLAGLLLAVISIPAMYALARAKLKTAENLGSRALRADAIEAITCGYLGVVVVISLVAQLIFRVWWVDGVASLAVVFFLVREGREAWRGYDCCK